MRRLLFVAVALADIAGAQVADTAARRPVAGTVTGVVRDSVAQMPLPGATIQLVAANDPAALVRTAVSDIYGQFAFGRVPAGKYKVGFLHPLLDSLGIDLPLREVVVTDEQGADTELGTPSPKRLRSLYCANRPDVDTASALLIGVVKNAGDGTPAANATVVAQWREYSFGKTGLATRMPHLLTTTADNGWFALCNVPNQGTVTVVASLGNDSTQMIEVPVPIERFMRRELFLGGHALNGRISGIVVTETGNQPIQGALISIVDGPGTRANEKGEFAISDAPAGTRVVEVRALGFYPERRTVDILNNVGPIRFALSTLQSVLDTVRVKASRHSNLDRTGFEDRRHNGPGRYYTASLIAKRAPTFISDIMRGISGIRIGFASDTLVSDLSINVDPEAMSTTDRRVLMRGTAGNWCPAAIYLDGMHFPGLSADDIDAWLRPDNVAGIEVYSEATVPNEFRQERSGCGSVVIWRK